MSDDMKIILSRKGFDSSYGGYPSPILPDGTILSIPIPTDIGPDLHYKDIKTPLDGPPHAPENKREEDRIKRDKLGSKGYIVIAFDFIDGRYDDDPSLIEKEVKEKYEYL